MNVTLNRSTVAPDVASLNASERVFAAALLTRAAPSLFYRTPPRRLTGSRRATRSKGIQQGGAERGSARGEVILNARPSKLLK